MISQCLNPDCLHINLEATELCEKCDYQLLLVNRYRAISLLGQGGFGRTFLAIDEFKPSQPRCVVKQFLPEVKGKNAIAKAAELFTREASRLDELGKHQQIPELLAFFNQEEHQYLIQEYIDGDDLGKELEAKGVFSQAQIEELLSDVLSVLEFVHENNVIHRDIKPENIIRRRKDGKLVLVDFGAAKADFSSDLSTATVIGSAAYIAPEQAAGKPKFSSDLYSLGATCLHLLTNVEPLDLFDTAEGEWMWRDYLQDNNIDYELSSVLDRLVEGATKRRFQSVSEVLQALGGNTNPNVMIPAAPNPKQPSRSQKASTPKTPTSRQPRKTKSQSPKSPQKSKLKVLEFQFATVSSDACSLIGTMATLPIRRQSGKAKYLTLHLNQDVTLDVIGVPGGKFTMGSPTGEAEREAAENPQHSVAIRPFFMGRYPVTQAQWQAVMHQNPSRFLDASHTSKKPVEKVSWYDAEQFCEELSQIIGRKFRLPSEAEWEYACRAKTQTPFHCGVTISTELANYNGEDVYDGGVVGENRHQTTDVDSFLANRFGLGDFHGNVAEWCADSWHHNYEDAPADGSAWTSNKRKDLKVLRGGSWLHLPGSCRSAQRFRSDPKTQSDAFGFRIASSL